MLQYKRKCGELETSMTEKIQGEEHAKKKVLEIQYLDVKYDYYAFQYKYIVSLMNICFHSIGFNATSSKKKN